MFERTCTNYKLPVVPRTSEARETELVEVELLRQAEGLTPKEEDYVAKRRALASAQKALDKEPSIAKMPFRLAKSFFDMIREVARG